jgi:hypothetical protein
MGSFSRLHNVLSPAFSILRQELDSMVRVIYLLSQDVPERERLIGQTLDGEKWKVLTTNGKWRNITDKEMVDLAQGLQGWTQSVYKFGCSFIHLSDFHNHFAVNPFLSLDPSEQQDILTHMRYYHGGPQTDTPSMEEIASYLLRVFEKIASNLDCYLRQLEQGELLDPD